MAVFLIFGMSRHCKTEEEVRLMVGQMLCAGISHFPFGCSKVQGVETLFGHISDIGIRVIGGRRRRKWGTARIVGLGSEYRPVGGISIHFPFWGLARADMETDGMELAKELFLLWSESRENGLVC
jgi:hypothetical protein